MTMEGQKGVVWRGGWGGGGGTEGERTRVEGFGRERGRGGDTGGRGRLNISPGSILKGWDVQPAYPPGAASGGAILPANLPQAVSSLTKDLRWVGSSTHPSGVCLCLQSQG